MKERRIKVTFIDKDGDKFNFHVAEGDNLLDIAQANDLEMEGKGFRMLIRNHVANEPSRCMRRLLCMFNVPRHRRK